MAVTRTRRCTKRLQCPSLQAHGRCTRVLLRPHQAATTRKMYTSTITSTLGNVNSSSTTPCAAPRHRLVAAPTHCRLLVARPHGLYVNLVVRREYSSLGRSGSTSTTPYAAATSSSGRTTTSTSLNQKTSRGRLPRHQQLVGSTSN
jgi:hypothetical protein